MDIKRKAHERKGGPRKGFVRRDGATVSSTNVKPAKVKAVERDD